MCVGEVEAGGDIGNQGAGAIKLSLAVAEVAVGVEGAERSAI